MFTDCCTACWRLAAASSVLWLVVGVRGVHTCLCALVLHNPLLLVICQQVTQMKALGLKVPAVTGNAGLRSKDYSGKNRSNMQRLLG